MGLAVYNSIILDIRFPPVCYKKLLSPAVVPYNNPRATVGIAPVSIKDLKEAMPVCNGTMFVNNEIHHVCMYKQESTVWKFVEIPTDQQISLCDIILELPVPDFLLVFSSDVWPNSYFMRYHHSNLSDLDYEFSRSLKVKSRYAVGTSNMTSNYSSI